LGPGGIVSRARGNPLQHHGLGHQLHARKLLHVGGVVLHAFSDPASENLVRLAAFLHHRAAFVHHFANWLFQHEALFGQRDIEAAALLVPREAKIIMCRIESKQRETEPVLSLRAAVATAAVAIETHQHGHDVILKADRRRDTGIGHPHRSLDGLPGMLEDERGFAICEGRKDAPFIGGDAFGFKAGGSLAGDVHGDAIRAGRDEGDALALEGMVKLDGRRKECQ